MNTLFSTTVRKPFAFGVALLSCLMVSGSIANAQHGQSPITKGMGITQRLGESVPKDALVKDEAGKTIRFGDVLGKRPVIFLPVFYECKTACPIITNNLLKTLSKAATQDVMIVGRDLDVVMLSIDPTETPEQAAARKAVIVKAFAKPGTEHGFRLLTGDLASIRKITDSVGFQYRYDTAKHLISHPMGSAMLSPQGKIAKYTIGNNFPTKIAEEGLAVAARNEVGDVADQSQMFGCLMLDPATTRNRPLIQNIMRVGGLATLLILIGSIISMNAKYKRSVLPPGGNQGA